jgi:glucokinase
MDRVEVVLAGDVGGTNTRLALYPRGRVADPLLLRVYPSAAFTGLQPIVARFLAEAAQLTPRVTVRRAAFGVAGPAEGIVVKFTNLPWIERADGIASAFGLEHVVFINDFAAICRAVPHLAPADLVHLGGGTPHPEAPKAVLGAGTGLGAGFLVHCGASYRVVASEAGHMDFAPRGPQQTRLADYLAAHRGGAYVENVLSGRGLANLYAFLRDSEGLAEAPDVRTAMEREDPAAVISSRALAGADPLCDRTLDLFCEIYGAMAATLALLVMARGGVYLAGGIAGHIRARLQGGPFQRAFEQHVRYSDFLRSVPRNLIVHPQPGLLGAALAAAEEPGAHFPSANNVGTGNLTPVP